MKTRILITGASGFVGRSLLKELSGEADLSLSILVRDSRKSNDPALRGINIYEGDITRPETLKGSLADQDIVVHCAALMSNFDSEPREKFYMVNTLGTANLLKACDSRTLKRFIHISTAGVYGATGNWPAGEDAQYGMALSTYEWSKKEAELVILRYARERHISFTILRPSQMYGTGMRYGWPETIKAVKSEAFALPGDGRSKIHLLNIKDFVESVKLVIHDAKRRDRIYNIAGPEVVNFKELFCMISETLKVRHPKRIPYIAAYSASLFLSLIPYRLKNKKLRLVTPHRVRFFATNHVYDISRAKSELGYHPSFNVRKGFYDMIRWCEEERLF